jgi:4-amino-4-deoxy-L-arabinose transferase-like glycosyltransferase
MANLGSASAPDQGRRWLVALAMTAAALALYLPGIGTGDFVGDDESLDAGVVWEMVHSGDWLYPEFNGEYLPPKPPAFYWAAAIASRLHGAVDEWSLRVPSALSGAATVGLTVAGTAALFGVAPAASAGVMLATMPLFFGQSRVGRCDMLLALLVTTCLFLATDAKRAAAQRSVRWLFWTLLGVAALTKGGAGVGLVAVVLLAAAMLERDAGRLRALADPAAIAIFVIVGASWYALAARHWGTRFVDEQIVGENLHHLVGGGAVSDVGSGTTPLAEHLVYYVEHLPLHMFPWAFLLPFAFVERPRGEFDRASLRFFMVWLVAGFAFFTIVRRKSPYYLLPLTPAVAVMASVGILGRLRESFAARAFAIPISVRGVGAIAAGSLLAWLLAAHFPGGSCESRAIGGALWDHPFASLLGLGTLAASVALLANALRQRHVGLGFVASVAVLVASFTLVALVDGPVEDCGSLKPFAREVAGKVGGDEQVFFFRSPLPAVALYAERRIPTLRKGDSTPPSRPFYLVVPESLTPEVPPCWLAAAETVASARGRVFTRRPMTVRLLKIAARSGNEGDEVPVGPVPGSQEARQP